MYRRCEHWGQREWEHCYRRPSDTLSASPRSQRAKLALLLLGYFLAAAGTILAAKKLPVLLLTSRGPPGSAAPSWFGASQPRSMTSRKPHPLQACQGSFASGHLWTLPSAQPQLLPNSLHYFPLELPLAPCIPGDELLLCPARLCWCLAAGGRQLQPPPPAKLGRRQGGSSSRWQ